VITNHEMRDETKEALRRALIAELHWHYSELAEVLDVFKSAETTSPELEHWLSITRWLAQRTRETLASLGERPYQVGPLSAALFWKAEALKAQFLRGCDRDAAFIDLMVAHEKSREARRLAISDLGCSCGIDVASCLPEMIAGKETFFHPKGNALC
jgi:hypothetical protein